MRPYLVMGNWKMNQLSQDVTNFFSTLACESPNDSVTVGVAPVALHLQQAVSVASDRVWIGAQNCHHETEGAHTGELSVTQIKDAGARFVILGHSERRSEFSESSKLVNAKAKTVQATGLRPLICVGENLDERKKDQTEAVVLGQVVDSVKDLDPSNLTLAYEPIWAIGTGLTATPEQAQEVHAAIRSKLRELFGESADSISVLYGGSVKPDNASGLLQQQDIDGALVGGASLNSESFNAIISAANDRVSQAAESQ